MKKGAVDYNTVGRKAEDDIWLEVNGSTRKYKIENKVYFTASI